MVGLQEALASLVTDRALRRRYATEPEAALRMFELSDRERAALCAIPLAALERYAESLEQKRWTEVARVIPRTQKIAPSVARHYRRWLGANPALATDTVLSPGAFEALRALSAVCAELSNEGEADYAADLFAYEVLAAASRGDGKIRALRSRFALHEIVSALDQDTIPIDPDQTPYDYRFERSQIRRKPA